MEQVVEKPFLKRVLVINQYFPPDIASTGQYAADICKGMAKNGFEVYVVTAQPSYTSSSPLASEYEYSDSIYIHRVSLGNNKGRDRLKTRLLGYLYFLWGSWLQSKRLLNSRDFDFIITFHNPPLVGVLGAYLAKKHKLSFIYIPYDIHPDILKATGWKLPSPIIWVWELINKYVFSRAEKIVVLSEGMKDILVNGKGVSPEKVKVIPLWALQEIAGVPDTSEIRRKISLNENELLFLYSGNMGTLHNLDPSLDAANLLRNLPVKFLFIGDGIKKPHLLARIEEEKLKNVTVLPYQPEDRYLQILSVANACFVVIAPGLEKLNFPSRAFTFLSAGKPIIALMSEGADLAKLIIRAECGWVVNNGKEIAELIHNLYRNPQQITEKAKKAKKVYDLHFRKEVIIREYLKILEE